MTNWGKLSAFLFEIFQKLSSFHRKLAEKKLGCYVFIVADKQPPPNWIDQSIFPLEFMLITKFILSFLFMSRFFLQTTLFWYMQSQSFLGIFPSFATFYSNRFFLSLYYLYIKTLKIDVCCANIVSLHNGLLHIFLLLLGTLYCFLCIFLNTLESLKQKNIIANVVLLFCIQA